MERGWNIFCEADIACPLSSNKTKLFQAHKHFIFLNPKMKK
jgi:hypothetical protein